MAVRGKIIVLGYIVRLPFGGMTWHHLNYVLGLQALGYEVIFLEDSDDFDDPCYDPSIGRMTDDPAAGLRYAAEVFKRSGFGDAWAYWRASAQEWLGPLADRVAEEIADADILLNVSGVNPVRPWLRDIPIRVYLDTDPAFQQIRMLKEPERQSFVEQHNRFITFGSGIADGTATLTVPDLPWIFSPQPVALDHWRPRDLPKDSTFTSVLNWDSYRTETWNGVEYGMKSASFREYVDLPQRTSAQLTLALSGSSAPVSVLREKGWTVVSGPETTRSTASYEDFLAQSLAEFSVAKHGYVTARTGWFSERSACYLATGRPVVTQSTGFETWLPVGEGLLSFHDLEGAVEGIEAVRRDPARHAASAVEIACDVFDANKVLTRMIDDIMASGQAQYPKRS
ncbi:hypothetical protein [Tateyamaria pelophila]|uniref:hypothetical protein n=1 Tax=Tateyamaria pelophila TaxID=328415 RepID=UPI001CBE578B|nr:hypothetical protein [Tateyamaria pelophila]